MDTNAFAALAAGYGAKMMPSETSIASLTAHVGSAVATVIHDRDSDNAARTRKLVTLLLDNFEQVMVTPDQLGRSIGRVFTDDDLYLLQGASIGYFMVNAVTGVDFKFRPNSRVRKATTTNVLSAVHLITVDSAFVQETRELMSYTIDINMDPDREDDDSIATQSGNTGAQPNELDALRTTVGAGTTLAELKALLVDEHFATIDDGVVKMRSVDTMRDAMLEHIK